MSTPTFAIRLDNYSKLKGGYHPVVLQVIFDRKTRRIRLGMKAKKQRWDDNNLPLKYQEKIELAEDIYKKHFEGKRFDYTEFADLFRQDPSSKSFYDVAEEFIESKKKVGTRIYYKDVVKSVKKLNPNLPIGQVTPKFLFEHEKEYNSSAYMRGIKAIINYAIRCKYLDAGDNPFKTAYNPTGYSFSHIKQKRKPVAFSEEEIENYIALEDDTMYNDLALFSYYTFGINMWDFLQFTDDNLSDGAIHFTRSKTGVEVQVPLSDQAKKIIDRYQEGDRWFPLCDFSDKRKAKKRTANLRKKVSLRMKSNAEALGIKKKVSFYTMRHTAATIALKRGAPIEKISALLGHSDISITQNYLDKFESKELKSTIDLLA